MDIDLNDYDIDAIRDYLEDYFGTAMVHASRYAMIDIIDLDKKSDYEIAVMAYNMGILDNFHKRYIR